MKKIILLVVFISFAVFTRAQVITIHNDGVVPVKLITVTPPLRDLPSEPPTEQELNAPPVIHDNPSLEHPMIPVNPNALPIGEDPALQKVYDFSNFKLTNSVTTSVLSNWAGLKASVEPSDNNIAVGPSHVVQMTNNSTSSYMRIWDKSTGKVLVSNLKVNSFSKINDFGDPNIIYDEVADRYAFVVLYSGSASKLEVCVSKTNDPTGSWYVYSFSTSNGFPDYPKLAMWDNSYFITTNSNSPTIFALDRATMIAGTGTGTAQVFKLSSFPKIGFQSSSPVMQTGSTAPPSGEPAVMVRVADDAWGTTVGPDHLELFELSINWTNASLSTITGPIKINTAAYNSDLCSYGSGSCIPQKGVKTKLDPLSDIIMDKAKYRNLGSYESIVCTHVCNTSGSGSTGNAGVRWYELRRDSLGNWNIHQQGTYSPTTDYRFMSSISINDNGTIALGYNVSSSTLDPGISITGRDNCDPLGVMTASETTVKTGSAGNSSNRYGDYNGMVTDPSDGSFWFTGNYNPTSAWATNVVHFTLSSCPGPPREAAPTVAYNTFNIIPNPAGDQVQIVYGSSSNDNAQLQIIDVTGKIVIQQSQQLVVGDNKTTLDIHSLANGYYFVRLMTGNGSMVKKLAVQK